MTDAQILLELQELDLALERGKKTLADLPELRELAQKRAAYRKLISQRDHIKGVCCDLEAEIADLEDDQVKTEDEVTLAQEDAQRLKDYREVQKLEIELSDLAKKLDKIAFTLTDKKRELAGITEKAEKLNAYVDKFEKSLLADAQKTKAVATELQTKIDEQARRRDHLAASLGADMLAAYEESRRTHKGIAVETLAGSVPSACRMALTEASVEDLSRKDAIATCPYCGRILIQDTEA